MGNKKKSESEKSVYKKKKVKTESAKISIETQKKHSESAKIGMDKSYMKKIGIGKKRNRHW